MNERYAVFHCRIFGFSEPEVRKDILPILRCADVWGLIP